MATIKDIAKLAGVTYVTVSRALNNEPGVSEKTRRKVLDIAAELHYVPNAAAKRLADKTSHGIGLIWPDKEFPFFYRLCSIIEQEAAERGFAVMVSVSTPEEALRSFQSFFIHRIIHWRSNRPTAAYNEAREAFRGMLVEIGGRAQEGAHWIDIDRKGAIHQAVEHLVGLGHRRIAFVGAHTDKWVGFTEAQVAHQLEYAPERIVMTGLKDPDRAEKLGAFVQQAQTNGTTALVVDSQGILMDVVRQLQASSIRVPEHLSLVVYDDVPEIQTLLPVTITTVGPNLRLLAKTMIDAVTTVAEEAQLEEWKQLMVEAELIVRESTRSILPK